MDFIRIHKESSVIANIVSTKQSLFDMIKIYDRTDGKVYHI